MKIIFRLSLAILSILHLSAEPLIVAHRGASFAAPENTLASFKEAWKEGADGIELDIQLTKDGRIVAIHDGATQRVAGQRLVVSQSTFEELRKLDVGSWKDEKWKGEPIPLLEEVLEQLPDGKIVYIEIKCGPQILPELTRVIEASGKAPEQIIIIDFSYDNLVKAKPLMPEIKMLFLVRGKLDEETKEDSYPDLDELVTKVMDANLNGLDVSSGFPLDSKSVAKMKSKGLTLAVWTVNNPAQAKLLAEVGVDAITTDKPELIRTKLEEDSAEH